MKRFKVKQVKVWRVIDTENEDFSSCDFGTKEEAEVRASDYEVST